MMSVIDADNNKRLVDRIMQRWRAGVNYKRSQGYYEEWGENQRFWEADQWPAPTESTKNFPRPVTNYFAHVIEMKVSALTFETPELFFEPTETDAKMMATEIEGFDIEGANLLSEAAKHLSEAEYMELTQLLEDGLRTAAGVAGTGIWYFPWDNSIRGGAEGRNKFVGDIRGEEIDPADFFVGNPNDPNIQSQPYIIVTERLPISEVKGLYREHAAREILNSLSAESVSGEEVVYDQQRVEQSDTDYITLVHQWWKEFDEDEGRKVLNYAVVAQSKPLREEREIYKHGIYPFVSMQWYPRRKSFYGKPEANDLKPNQKERNRMEGMALLNLYAHGTPKTRYKKGAVDPRQFNNDPFQPIEDRYQGQGWGVDHMNPPQFPTAIPQMIELLTEGMKDATRAHDAFAGKAPSAELNASAIRALQEAAGITIRPIQRRLYRAMRDIGRIWLAHWKEFYTESRLIRITGADNQRAFAWFRGTDFKDMAFDVKVKATSASPFGRTLYMATLDSLLERQVIDPQMYLELLPADVFPQIDRLLMKLEQRKQEELKQQEEEARLQQQLQQQQQVAPQPQPAPDLNAILGSIAGGGGM